MSEWFGGLSLEQQIYYGVALVSSGVVLLQLAAMMFGVGAEELMDAGDVDMDGPDDHPSGLALVSSRTVFAFFVGFGWTGAISTGDGGSGMGPAIGATAVGLVFGYAIIRLMGFLHTLRHSGSLDYENALGETGSVYLEVHPGLATGGQVEVLVQGRLRVVQALTRGLEPIRRGARVEIVELMDPTTLVVAPIDEERMED